ncbi:MAG: MFS transporter [Armatimonadota bacterium]
MSNDLRVGTLEYTKRGLVMVFIWLLWGDFCFTLMETVEPAVLPFMLKSLGASNLIISTYISTIANAFNLTVCPVVSFMSDRYRSKRGRRIPYLAFATPFVGLFLILTGFARPIGNYFFTHYFHHSVSSEAALTIGLLAVLVAGYQFFNMIVGSVYYYLFNDVVPEKHLGRFMAFFRAVGAIAGSLFSFFVFQYARNYSSEIFIWFGIIYIIGFMMMCMKVKEGDYPPPPEMEKSRNSTFAGIKTFFKESYCHKFYWYFYLSGSFWMVSLAVNTFVVFRNLDIGLTMKEMGIIGGVAGVVTTVLLIPAGYYADKNHPIRVGITAMTWTLIFVPLNAIFLLHMGHHMVLILTIITTAITLPVNAVLYASELPLFMRLLPHTRYGQFSSANAVVRSAMMMVAGVLCGSYMDWLKYFFMHHLHIGGDYYYRLFFFWILVFGGLALFFRVKLYKLWLKFGGDDNFLPPRFEEDELSFRKMHSHIEEDAGSALASENAE